MSYEIGAIRNDPNLSEEEKDKLCEAKGFMGMSDGSWYIANNFRFDQNKLYYIDTPGPNFNHEIKTDEVSLEIWFKRIEYAKSKIVLSDL